MDHIKTLCNILSKSKMVWFLLRNMENIALSVGSIAQYRFSLSCKVVQWTLSGVNNYGYKSKRRREKIYFRLYRSISFFTGFVKCQEHGLQQQNKKNEQYEQLLRKYRESSVIDKSWLGGIASRIVVFLFSNSWRNHF
jgi:hypothetical protein